MILIFITYALFASAIISNKIILSALPPSMLVGLRMFIGGIILHCYNIFFAGYRFDWKQLRAHLLLFIFIALATTVIPSILKAYGLKYMVSSKAAFFGSLDPFITAIYASFFFGEQVSVQKIIGITLGFLGTSTLLFAGYPIDEPLKAFAEFSWPELALLGAVLVSRLGWMVVQRLLKRNIYKPSQINSVMMFIGGTVALGWSFFTDQFTLSDMSHSWYFMKWWPFSSLSNTGLIALCLSYTVIGGNLLAYTSYGYLLKHYSATLVSLTGFTVPLFVALFGWLFLAEPLAIQFFIACIVTFTGMLLFFHDERKTTS